MHDYDDAYDTKAVENLGEVHNPTMIFNQR
jgi:hypothetical protein